jgi:hypothetical protein
VDAMSKPTPRKREKKVAREQKARAKVAQRRRARFEKVAAAVDPSRNLHVERGRAITVRDIAPHARAKCTKCKGTGIVAKIKDADGNVVGATPCACATRKFFQRHPELIVEKNGAGFWPKEDDATSPAWHNWQPKPGIGWQCAVCFVEKRVEGDGELSTAFEYKARGKRAWKREEPRCTPPAVKLEPELFEPPR